LLSSSKIYVPDKTKLNDPYEGLIEPIVFEEFDPTAETSNHCG
jgi:hypothetical protein